MAKRKCTNPHIKEPRNKAPTLPNSTPAETCEAVDALIEEVQTALKIGRPNEIGGNCGDPSTKSVKIALIFLVRRRVHPTNSREHNGVGTGQGKMLGPENSPPLETLVGTGRMDRSEVSLIQSSDSPDANLPNRGLVPPIPLDPVFTILKHPFVLAGPTPLSSPSIPTFPLIPPPSICPGLLAESPVSLDIAPPDRPGMLGCPRGNTESQRPVESFNTPATHCDHAAPPITSTFTPAAQPAALGCSDVSIPSLTTHGNISNFPNNISESSKSLPYPLGELFIINSYITTISTL